MALAILFAEYSLHNGGVMGEYSNMKFFLGGVLAGLTIVRSTLTAAKRTGNNLKGFTIFYLNAKAKIWP